MGQIELQRCDRNEAVIDDFKVGETVTVAIKRDEQQLDIQVTLQPES